MLASGVRLFATAIPVHLITGLELPRVASCSSAVFTLVYTYLGGLKAVVAMDVVQMFIYLSGAVASMVLIRGTVCPAGGATSCAAPRPTG